MSEQSKAKTGDNIIFYDGVCGLCNSLVQFVIVHSKNAQFVFCALQSNTASNLLAPYNVSNDSLKTIVVLTNYQLASSKLLTKSKAVFFILKHCQLPWYLPWTWLNILSLLPEYITNFGYDLIASMRYQIFGRYESCLMPGQKVMDRFIDQ